MINDTNIQKARISIKVLTLIPVFFLGIVALVSNISSIINIRSVNGTATTIADEYMESIAELGDIQREAQNIHKKALSHIIATDFNTMLELVARVIGLTTLRRTMSNATKNTTIFITIPTIFPTRAELYVTISSSLAPAASSFASETRIFIAFCIESA